MTVIYISDPGDEQAGQSLVQYIGQNMPVELAVPVPEVEPDFIVTANPEKVERQRIR